MALGGGGGGNVYYSQVSNTRSGLNVGGSSANLGGNGANGTVNFANNQSYTGVSAVNTNSTLALDFSDALVTPTANGTNVNILNPGNEVDLAGGGLTDIGNGSGASASQTLGNVKLLAGGTDTITANQTGSNALTVNLGVLGTGAAGGTLTTGFNPATGVAGGGNGASALIQQTGTGAATITTSTAPNPVASDAGTTYGGQVVYSSAPGTYTWATGTSIGTNLYQIGALTTESVLPTTGSNAAGDYLMASGTVIGASETINLLHMTGGILTTTVAKTLTINGGGILLTGSTSMTVTGAGLFTGTAVNSGGFNFLNLQNYTTGNAVVTLSGIPNSPEGVGAVTTLVLGGTGIYSLASSLTPLVNTGGLILDGATLQQSNSSLGAGSGLFTINSGTILGTGTGLPSTAPTMAWNGNFNLGAFTQGITGLEWYQLRGTAVLNNNIVITANNPAFTGWEINTVIGDDGRNFGLTINTINSTSTINLDQATNTFTGPLTIEGPGDVTIDGGGATTNRFNVLNIGPGSIVAVVGSGNALTTAASLSMAGLNDLGVANQLATLKDGNSSANFALTLWGSGNYSFGGNIMDNTQGSTGKTSLTMNGLGTQALTGSNSFSGGITVNAGTLLIDASKGGSVAAANTLALGGGTFELKNTASGTAASQTLGAVSLTAGGSGITVLNNGNGSAATLTLGTLAAPATLGATLNVQGTNIDFNTAYNAATGNATAGSHMVFTNGSTTTWATNTNANTATAAYSGDSTTLVASAGSGGTNYNLQEASVPWVRKQSVCSESTIGLRLRP